MTDLYAYSFDQFLSLSEDDRNTYKTFGLLAGAESYGTPEALEWNWGDVKEIQDLINKESISFDDMIEAVCKASKKDREQILKEKWYWVFKFYNFVVKEIEHINELEKQLAYEPDAKEVNSGIDNFRQFGWFVTLYRLAEGNPLRYKPILRQSYADIFATLKLQLVDMQFQKNLIKQNSHV